MGSYALGGSFAPVRSIGGSPTGCWRVGSGGIAGRIVYGRSVRGDNRGEGCVKYDILVCDRIGKLGFGRYCLVCETPTSEAIPFGGSGFQSNSVTFIQFYALDSVRFYNRCPHVYLLVWNPNLHAAWGFAGGRSAISPSINI